jgi:multidrug efflux system membrane fusion protein
VIASPPLAQRLGQLILVGATLLAVGCGDGAKAQAKPGAGKGGPPAPVVTAIAAIKDVPRELSAIGTIRASSSIAIRSQVTGALTEIHFKEGDDVARGQLLFTVDQRPLRRAVAQAEANLARTRSAEAQAEANLARDQAQATNAEREATRYAGLQAQGITTAEQVEQLRSAAEAARATVAADQAAIATGKAATTADEAAVETARVQLGYCEIRSPSDGRVGMLGANQGALVTANDTVLVTVNRLKPIYAVFSLPETQLAALREHGAAGALPVVAKAPASGGDWHRDGSLDLIDNQVDQTTGTIAARATFANADAFLWPGQFIGVTVTLELERGVVTVPSQAVQTGQRGDYIYVVGADQTAEARPVTVERLAGADAIIAKGIAAGETVITDGQVRVAPGGKVAPTRPDDAAHAAGGDSHAVAAGSKGAGASKETGGEAKRDGAAAGAK